MTRRVRPEPRPTEGFLKPYAVGASVVLAFALCCLLIQLQSPSIIFWTGERIEGSNEGGIAYYTVNGVERTLDARGPVPASPEPVIVYVDPDEPSRDRVLGPEKWLDAGLVAVPFLAAAAVLSTGLIRRRRVVARAAAAASLLSRST